MKFALLVTLIAILTLQTAAFGKGKKKNMGHYETLGVPKTATDQDIHKAFKKQARIYHPDKNQDDPIPAKEKFQEISNAYEILSDPDKRRVYDMQGDEGVRSQEQRQGQPGGGQNMNIDLNLNDIFNSFFGGQGGQNDFFGGQGNDFFGNQGGQRKQQNRHKTPQSPDLFQNTDVIILDLKSIFKFYKRSEEWIILFYDSKSEQSKQIESEYKELAKKMEGIIKVGAVNCRTQQDLCEEFNFDLKKGKMKKHPQSAMPVAIIYSKKSNEEGQVYTGEFNWKKISDLATSKMTNYVLDFKFDQFESFLAKDSKKHHILIVLQEGTEMPAAFKSLSSKYLYQLVFGQITKPPKALMDKYWVSESLLNRKGYVILIFLDNEGSKDFKYTGDMRFSALDKLFNEYAIKDVKAPVKYQKMTQSKHESGLLCDQKTNEICVIYFGKPTQAMDKLVEEFGDNRVKFAYIAPKEPGFNMKTTHFEGSNLVLYKAKRLKWMKVDNLTKSLINDVVNGSGQWEKAQPLEFSPSNQKIKQTEDL